jgi:hypothetical protein
MSAAPAGVSMVAASNDVSAAKDKLFMDCLMDCLPLAGVG